MSDKIEFFNGPHEGQVIYEGLVIKRHGAVTGFEFPDTVGVFRYRYNAVTNTLHYVNKVSKEAYTGS